MGKVTIELPDDGWIATGKGITPEDKELVIAISRYGTRTPQIYQFCKANPMHPASDYFLDIGEYWMMEEYDSNYEWNPGLMSINAVDRWKPLGLPQEDDERLKAEIAAVLGDEEQESVEKGAAILAILEMETHNSVTKAAMLKVIDYLLHLAFDVLEPKEDS